ncbi:ATP-binding protein [Paracoccaceae bacterium]|nr:ATP-binding protein [Paracoccaceae bacterium]
MEEYLKRIAISLERAFPGPPKNTFFKKADAFVWEAVNNNFLVVKEIPCVDLNMLKGMDEEISEVINNTRAFIKGKPANNVLIWGARGMGKSTLIKSVFNKLKSESSDLKIIEVSRRDIGHIDTMLKLIRGIKKKFIIFCDDISFDDGETTYKSLKSILDGGLYGGSQNALVYATSNRRHLLSREYQKKNSFMRGEEELDERLSISDRFGISIGLYECDQNLFLDIVASYVDNFNIDIERKDLEMRAREWQVQRGGRSGRVAWQFVVSLLNNEQ